jgi:hypothetical protein
MSCFITPGIIENNTLSVTSDDSTSMNINIIVDSTSVYTGTISSSTPIEVDISSITLSDNTIYSVTCNVTDSSTTTTTSYNLIVLNDGTKILYSKSFKYNDIDEKFKINVIEYEGTFCKGIYTNETEYSLDVDTLTDKTNISLLVVMSTDAVCGGLGLHV